MDESSSVVPLSGQGGQGSFTFPGPHQTQGMVVLWQQLKVAASSPIAHSSSALHSHTNLGSYKKARLELSTQPCWFWPAKQLCPVTEAV